MSLGFSLRDLEYLVAVAEELHFGRAAERCFVSQPTLSGQLKKLEEMLGLQLIERTNKQVIVTEAGHAVIAAARRTLAEAKAIQEIAALHKDPNGGELHVGLIPTIAPYLLPVIIPALREALPRLRLYLHEHQTAVLLEKLGRAELDLLVLALPVAGTEGFAELDLYQEPFWLAVPNDDEAAKKKQAVLDDIHNREILLLEEGHCLRGHALDVCFSAGASAYAGFQGTSLETVRQMVAEGIGITLMPQLAVPQQARDNDPIQYRRFKDPKPTRGVGLLYRRSSPRTGLFGQMAEIIKTTVAERLK